MPEVLSFGNIRSLEIHHRAYAPVRSDIVRYTAVKSVSLEGLAARSELQHIHRIESRTDEHRTAHVVALCLDKRERAFQGHLLHMTDAAGYSTGAPSLSRLRRITELSSFISAEDLGIRTGNRILTHSGNVA